jgi:hypothetical protein
MTTAIRAAMDAYNDCSDGVSGYSLILSLRSAVLSAITEIADRHGCSVSEETAGSGSHYISIDRDDADGEADVSLKIRVANHAARYANDWSFVPTDSEKSVLFGLATIERLCQ